MPEHNEYERLGTQAWEGLLDAVMLKELAMHNVATTYRTAADGRPETVRLRLINDDILVRLLPPRALTSGGLFIPDTAGDRGDEGIHARAEILAFGFHKNPKTGERVPLPGLEVGLRCVFTRFYAEQHSNKQIQERFGEGIIKVKPIDILVLYTPDEEHRILA